MEHNNTTRDITYSECPCTIESCTSSWEDYHENSPAVDFFHCICHQVRVRDERVKQCSECKKDICGACLYRTPMLTRRPMIDENLAKPIAMCLDCKKQFIGKPENQGIYMECFSSGCYGFARVEDLVQCVRCSSKFCLLCYQHDEVFNQYDNMCCECIYQEEEGISLEICDLFKKRRSGNITMVFDCETITDAAENNARNINDDMKTSWYFSTARKSRESRRNKRKSTRRVKDRNGSQESRLLKDSRKKYHGCKKQIKCSK